MNIKTSFVSILLHMNVQCAWCEFLYSVRPISFFNWKIVLLKEDCSQSPLPHLSSFYLYLCALMSTYFLQQSTCSYIWSLDPFFNRPRSYPRMLPGKFKAIFTFLPTWKLIVKVVFWIWLSQYAIGDLVKWEDLELMWFYWTF